MSDVWVAEDPGPPFQRLLVLGISDSVAERLAFEREFAGVLQGVGGAEVTAAGRLIEPPVAPDEAKLRRVVKDSKCDGVVVVRVLGVDTEVRSSGYGGVGPRRYYRHSFYGAYGAPAEFESYDVVRLEASLHRLPGEALVWTGTSNLIDPSSATSAARSLANAVGADLVKRGLLPPRHPRASCQ